MFFLKPSIRKRAKILTHHLRRYLNFKRDLLSHEQREAIQGQIQRIAAAKSRGISHAEFDALEKQVNEECAEQLPKERQSGLAETVETVIVVAALLLGVKSYIAQPFKIPTNSMLPTLNGVVATYTEEGQSPGMARRVWDALLGGQRHVEYRADGPLDLTQFRAALQDQAETEGAAQGFNRSHITEQTVKGLGLLKPIGLFNYSVLQYDDGTKSGAFYLPPTRLANLIMQTAKATGKYQLKKGDLLARGVVKTGDHVLVNKFSYHFRQPRRGEVFVFTTEGLNTRTYYPGTNKPVIMHYIKRLNGLPGDEITIRPPELRINGKPPEEFGIKRVIAADQSAGYHGYTRGGKYQRVTEDGWVVYNVPASLSGGRGGYFAMGDNSGNSSDSREIGAVPEENLVGPALMCYWPIFPHFGPIR